MFTPTLLATKQICRRTFVRPSNIHVDLELGAEQKYLHNTLIHYFFICCMSVTTCVVSNHTTFINLLQTNIDLHKTVHLRLQTYHKHYLYSLDIFSCHAAIFNPTVRPTVDPWWTTDHPGGPCYPDPCRHDGTCTVLSGATFRCTCQHGYTGTVCQIPPEPCRNFPCLNDGICKPVGFTGSYQCDCIRGFFGNRCQFGSGKTNYVLHALQFWNTAKLSLLLSKS